MSTKPTTTQWARPCRSVRSPDFLKSAAATAAAVPAMMGVSATPALRPRGESRGHSIPRENISIQLYTLRNLSLEATLQGLAAIGYRKVEHAGFGTRTAAEFRAALQQAGLRATSGHQAIPQPWNDSAWYQQVADAVAVGPALHRHAVEPDHLSSHRRRVSGRSRA